MSIQLMTSAAPAALAANLAFVVGINEYEHLDNGKLHRAVADAKAIALALRGIRFEVTEVVERKDAALSQLVDRFTQFAHTVQPGDTVFIFFSGHGMQRNGTNYLLPSDAAHPDKSELLTLKMALKLEELMQVLDVRKPGRRILVLDACRNDPYNKKATDPHAKDGLANVKMKDSFILYSASSGQTALDRLSRRDTEPNSPFVRILLRYMTQPNLLIQTLSVRVVNDVASLASQVSHDQQPDYRDGLLGNFCLVPEGENCVTGTAAFAAASEVKTAAVAAAKPSLSASPSVPASPLQVSAKTASVGHPAVAPAQSPAESRATRAPVHACDTLAAFNRDPNSVVAGVHFSKLKHAEAIPACKAALEANPKEVRFVLQLSRAYQASKTPENVDRAIEIVQPLAEAGNPSAMHRLTSLHWSAQNFSAFREWVDRCIAGGEVRCLELFGLAHEQGKGVPLNQSLAIDWFRRGADAGNLSSMVQLGTRLRDGKGIEKNEKIAAQWLRKASERGELTAMVHLGFMHVDGRGVPKGEKIAFDLFKRAAEGGDTYGMKGLAWAYEKGIGTSKNDAEVVAWVRKAAEDNDAQAMTNLGRMYLRGSHGQPKSPSQAMALFKKAVGLKDPGGMTSLGLMLYDGNGIPQDVPAAVALWRQAAETGDREAMTNLGIMYREGRGVEQSHAEAIKWFERGAAAGSGNGMASLGEMYTAGKGVPRDTNKAFQYFKRGALANNPGGMKHMGIALIEGEGTVKDVTEGVRWVEKAAKAGHPGARDYIRDNPQVFAQR